MKMKIERDHWELEESRMVRKKMPPSGKIIRPKNEFRRERFDWRKEIENQENEGNDDE